jgi:CheY-like chemotaxis protein
MQYGRRQKIRCGLEAAEEIRSAWRWEEPLAIIAFSANVNAEDIAAARLVGMERHVAKPVEPGELARTIRECLAERIAAQRPTG